ncbi:hypothetical protein J2N86_09655 [Legionella lytica]|uniref:Transmembrane protein n=1 Tax=Legionella lytica TaxID=96232 RepID=A0ABY4Y690_9GAMM|nr:hypothetical protein [Legionella lytica]USQ12966.1 hypothetical protein J2N86_09655 [Legionella lytica]
MIEIFITLAALLLAFFALINPTIQFRLNMSWLNMRRFYWILAFLGLIAILYLPCKYFLFNNAAILKSTANHYNLLTSEVNYNLFIDLTLWLWSFALIGLCLFLLSKIITPVKFNRRNSKSFFEQSNLIISSGVREAIGNLTVEVAPSIPKIFDLAASRPSKAQSYAYELLELFSDELFCNHIIHHNPIALTIIFEKVTKVDENLYPIGTNLVNKLIALMITKPESQLNREEQYGGGIGRFAVFKELVFGNVNFIKSQYRPLSAPFLNKESSFNSKGVNKYFEIIKFTIERYLSGYDDNPDVFFSALDVITEVITTNINHLINISDEDNSLSDAYCTIKACGFGMNRLISMLATSKIKMPIAPQISVKNYSYFKNDKTIYDAIAIGIFNVMEQLSRQENYFENIRLLIVNIYKLSLGKKSYFLKVLRPRLNLLLCEKIEHNLIDASYPPISAALIYSLSLCEPNKAKLKIHKKLLLELKKNYIQLYSSKREIALDMIPKDTTINVKTRKLIRRDYMRWTWHKTEDILILD